MEQRIFKQMESLYDDIMELVNQVKCISEYEKRIDTLREDVLDLTETVAAWEQAAYRLEEAYTASDSQLDEQLDSAIQGILSLLR